MATAELKTKVTNASVADFIAAIPDATKRSDAEQIDKLMRAAAGENPKMWGSAIIGYGEEHLKYDSGRELDWMKIGFSPRKQNITLYVLRGGEQPYRDLLAKLGKHKTGKGCLYINHLSDVDENVLQQIIAKALKVNHDTKL